MSKLKPIFHVLDAPDAPFAVEKQVALYRLLVEFAKLMNEEFPTGPSTGLVAATQFLSFFTAGLNEPVGISASSISTATGIPRTTVNRRFSELEDMGYMKTLRHQGLSFQVPTHGGMERWWSLITPLIVQMDFLPMLYERRHIAAYAG